MWLLWTALWLAQPARAELIDRVLVVVGDDPLLASDLAADAWLQRYDVSPSPFWAVEPTDALARLIEAAVVRQLAGEVALYRPADEDVERRWEAVMLATGAPAAEVAAAWTAAGLDGATLRTQLRRRMVVERYLARNLLARPDQPELWAAAYAELIDRERPRARVRAVAPGSPR